MKPLFIPLRSEYFDAFASGKKTCEWRIYGPRWNEKTCTPGREVTLSKGYGKHQRLRGIILSTCKHIFDDPVHVFNRVYGEKAKGAIAFEIRVKVEQ
jgi:ASC-1-like (ASCH) protein